MISNFAPTYRIAPKIISPARKTILFFTIGYEQTNTVDFMERLKSHEVELVVDVRQMPLSRKKGFSKNSLRVLLEQDEISYIHMRTLGAPREVRDRLRENGSWVEYVKGYQPVLRDRQEDLVSLIDMTKSKRICLLCFERRPEECHRSLVAAQMEKLGLGKVEVEHIRY